MHKIDNRRLLHSSEFYSVLCGDLSGEEIQKEGTYVSVGAVQSLSRVRLFAAPWTAALSVTVSQSLLKFTFIELVMPSNHLVLCHPLLLLPSVFPSIRVLLYIWLIHFALQQKLTQLSKATILQ